MKLRITTIAVLLTLLAGILVAGGWWYFSGRRYVVVITQDRIDEVLRTKFPITKSYLLLFQVKYSNPHARMLPDSERVEIGLDAELNVRLGKEPKRLGGTVLATTGLSYRSDTYEFYLSDPQITQLSVQGVPPEVLEKVQMVTTALLGEYLPRHPVYTLEDETLKKQAVRLLLRDVQVRNREIHCTLGL